MKKKKSKHIEKKPSLLKRIIMVLVSVFIFLWIVPEFILSKAFPEFPRDILNGISLLFTIGTSIYIFIRYKRRKLFITLLLEAKTAEQASMKTNRIVNFLVHYNKAIQIFSRLIPMEKKVKRKGKLPSSESGRLIFEYPWHLREAVEREYDSIVENATTLYRNNREKITSLCDNFKSSIEDNRDKFDDESYSLASGLIGQLNQMFGTSALENNTGSNKKAIAPDASPNHRVIHRRIDEVDLMEGLQFEIFCAELFRKMGYCNVEVTKSSGDHGVDVLAEKEDVRYAIQCKRYRSKLGNTPVQEITAGKTIYGCQVGIVVTNQYFTEGAIQLAHANGVLLRDRDWLIQALEQYEE